MSAATTPCPHAADHFRRAGYWNDDGAWVCNGPPLHFVAYAAARVADRLREDADDREDRAAITTFPEVERAR